MRQVKGQHCQSAVSKPRRKFACYELLPVGTLKLAVLVVFVSFLSGLPNSARATDPVISKIKSEIVDKSLVQLKDWDSYERSISLADGTRLHHYVSEVSSVDSGSKEDASASSTKKPVLPQPKLRLSFIPRFNCAPIISVVFPASNVEEEERKKILSTLSQLRFLVDGTRIAFPALTEYSDASLMAHYDTELRRRNNFRILVEAGSSAQIELGYPDGNNSVYSYSLIGSKRAITRSRGNCQSHTSN